MKIKNVAIDTVIPYARNPRNNQGAIAKVAGSIKEFGWQQPIVVDSEMVVIAGHTRLAAAQSLGMKKVPIVIAENLTPAQVKAYRLADNRVSQEAEWDHDLLTLELQDLVGEEYNLDLTGFSDDELAALLAEETEGLTDEDAVPDVPENPVTVLGDVWVMGDHRLMCGDSTSIDAVDRLMDGQKADMVFTDPPWNVNYGAVATPKYKQGRQILNDSMGDEDWAEFCANTAASLFSATRPGAVLYCVMSAQEWPVVDKSLREAGFHWSSSIIWSKDSLVLSRKDYHTQYEPIWYGWNEKGPRLMEVPDRKQSDVWQCARPKKSELHPTTKPVELIDRAVKNSSWRGAIVLDLFGGSGSTLISCDQNGRHSRLMELDPKYCDVIVKRWQDFTGKKAVHAETGEEFNG